MKLKIADSHTHLDDLSIPLNKTNIQKELFDLTPNVEIFITIGTTLKDDFEWLTSYKNIYCTYGIHPVDYLKDENKDLKHLYIFEKLDYVEKILYEKINNNNKCVGVGEIGLDFLHNEINEYSFNLLHMQLNLAKKLNKPISVHARNCNIKELVDIIKNYDLSFVLHCYTGNIEDAFYAIENKGYISFSGIITFGKKVLELENVCKNIPKEKILVETDAPYLAPAPYRGKTNHPKYLIETLKHIGNIRNESLEEVGSFTYINTLDLFKINL